MKKAICIKDCTHGNPPKFYSEGDPLFFEGEKCPKHFRLAKTPAASVPAPVGDDNPDVGKALADVKTGGENAADLADKQTASESCTVKALAKELDVDVQLVKDAAGVTRQDEMLSGEKVDEIKAALAKTPAAPAPAGDDNPDASASEQEESAEG